MDKIMESPFSLILGFLSGLVLNEFIIKASTSLLRVSSRDTLLAQTLVICLGGFWIFYTIYGTVSWLMLTEYNPKVAGLPRCYPKMIFVRFLEFLPFIGLHNIVNIMGPTEIKFSATETYIVPGIAAGVDMLHLNRLSIEVGIILWLWTIWNIAWSSSLPTPRQDRRTESVDCKKSQGNKTLGLFLSGIVFLFIYPALLYFCPFVKSSAWLSLSLLVLLTVLYILLDILFIHRREYGLLTEALSAAVEDSPESLS